VFLFSGIANPTLTTIGTATYLGNDYNLIYMDDGPFGPVTWLDYTKEFDTWQTQADWASGLGADLMVTLDSVHTTDIDWTTGWRLPFVDESQANLSVGFGYEGPDGTGYHDYRYGYNMVNSEMGHLFYESLGNKGRYAKDGTNPQPGWGPENKGEFNDLYAAEYYWSGTEYSPDADGAWYFYFLYGLQRYRGKSSDFYALAVRPGEVSVVPIPGAFWILGSLMLSAFGVRRLNKNSERSNCESKS
jgi:hypothetical protein